MQDFRGRILPVGLKLNFTWVDNNLSILNLLLILHSFFKLLGLLVQQILKPSKIFRIGFPKLFQFFNIHFKVLYLFMISVILLLTFGLKFFNLLCLLITLFFSHFQHVLQLLDVEFSVYFGIILNLFCSLPESQCWNGLFFIEETWAARHDKGGLGVATQRLLQNPGQLGISVWYMNWLSVG